MKSIGKSGNIISGVAAAAAKVEAHDASAGAHGNLLRPHGTFSRFYDTAARPMSQKRIALFGNSTVDAANELFTRLATHAVSGGALDGVTVTPVVLKEGSGYVDYAGNISNQGHNGVKGGDMVPGGGNASFVDALIAYHPDLIIMRGPLINDVRLGAVGVSDARNIVRKLLDRITTAVPWCDILLLSENSLLTTDPGGFGWVSPATPAAAQAYSEILREAVLSFDGAYRNVVVFDTQAPLFGCVAPATSEHMLNQLHPNAAGRIAEADLIAWILDTLRHNPPSPIPSPYAGTNIIENARNFAAWSQSPVGGVTVNGNELTPGTGAMWTYATVVPGQQYTFSFYARKGATTATPYHMVYDHTHSALVAGSFLDYSAAINTAGWSRVSHTFTVPANCTRVRLYVFGGTSAGGQMWADRCMVNAGATALPWTEGIS